MSDDRSDCRQHILRTIYLYFSQAKAVYRRELAVMRNEPAAYFSVERKNTTRYSVSMASCVQRKMMMTNEDREVDVEG